MIKIIATDLDGTLLDSFGKIPKENVEILQRAVQEKDIITVVATGRPYSGACIFSRMFAPHAPLIVLNGALVRTDDTVIACHPMDNQFISEALKTVKSMKMYCHLYTENEVISESMDYGMGWYANWNKSLNEKDRIALRQVEDLSAYIEENNIKILKFMPMDEDSKKLGALRDAFTKLNYGSISSSFHNNFEIVHEGVSKGSALEEIARYYGIKRETIMVLGDNENDIEMFNFAGLSIAMENSIDRIKSIASESTVSNDLAGVAKAVRRHVFN